LRIITSRETKIITDYFDYHVKEK